MPGDARDAGDAGDAGAPPFDAVILAGGRAMRLGGADKPSLTVGGRTLAAAVVSAVTAAAAVIVVGPERPGLRAIRPADAVRFVREDPPGAGPVAALRRGIAEVSAPWLALLAADLPFLRPEHLRALLTAAAGPGAPRAAAPWAGAAGGAPGAILVDDDGGRPQWLIGCWRTGALAVALQAYCGRSLRGLLAPLRPVQVTVEHAAGGPPPWLDCDSPEDLRRAREWAGGAPR
jgi:molybdopterin-guanine dinucleotide biosynthesis protein A